MPIGFCGDPDFPPSEASRAIGDAPSTQLQAFADHLDGMLSFIA
jgi:hypothetical protein